MKQHKRKLALLAAAILACSAAGCAGTQNQSSAQSQSQLWVVDNSVDVQQDYVMENPSAIRGSDHAGAGHLQGGAGRLPAR